MFTRPPRFSLVLLIGALPLAMRSAENIEREIVLTPQAGAAAEDAEIRQWQIRAGAPAAKAADFERLGWAFVGKARRTLDAGYYALAEKTVVALETQFGASAESRLLRGCVFHNEHRFHEAESIARGLVAERGEPEDFGLLGDALMEQGKLTEAVEALQRMVNLKPGVEAYSRIAHVRWLKGDLSGATAMMEAAARATSPREAEVCAWTLSRLAGFYLQAGRLDAALNAANAAAARAPDYPPALLARGRTLLAEGKNAEAVDALQRATDLNPLPEYQWWLADALRAAGRAREAAKVEAALKARGAASDPRTFALFLATRGEEPAVAVRLAREELANRADVFTHDALAWALAASGDSSAAETEMRAALAEHTADARLFFHAGEIALARGDAGEAERFFAQARPLSAALTPSERVRLTAHAATATATACPPAAPTPPSSAN